MGGSFPKSRDTGPGRAVGSIARLLRAAKMSRLFPPRPETPSLHCRARARHRGRTARRRPAWAGSGAASTQTRRALFATKISGECRCQPPAGRMPPGRQRLFACVRPSNSRPVPAGTSRGWCPGRGWQANYPQQRRHEQERVLSSTRSRPAGTRFRASRGLGPGAGLPSSRPVRYRSPAGRAPPGERR